MDTEMGPLLPPTHTYTQLQHQLGYGQERYGSGLGPLINQPQQKPTMPSYPPHHEQVQNSAIIVCMHVCMYVCMYVTLHEQAQNNTIIVCMYVLMHVIYESI